MSNKYFRILVNHNMKLIHNLIIHTIIVLLFLVLSFIINKIPDGTFISGGDFYQLIDINNNINKDLFTWFNVAGQGQYNPRIVAVPFYIFQYVLFNFGFSYANIANAILFLFLISSFYSFFFAIRIIDEKIPNNIRLFSSANYAINIFTFTIFTYPWWITHQFIIYIFIPLLFAFFEKLVIRCLRKDVVYFTILFLISTMGFVNVAYLAAFLFIQVLFLIVSFVTKKIPLSLKTMNRILFVFILQFFLSIYFILPFVSQFESTISHVGKVMGDLVNWLSYSSSNVYSIFSFTMVKDVYPLINLYSSSPIYIAVSLGYIIFMTVTILYQKKKQEKYWLHHLMFFVLLLFLLMRLAPPFDRINLLIYTLPGFNVFRSPDKLFVFYPFFYLVLLSLLLYYSKFSNKIITAILIIILIIPIPFYIGGIPKYLSYEGQDGYKYTIQIPPEYYKIKEIINKDNTQLSIISLPYSVVNSLNWANYPKWHFVGQDVLYLLYNKFYISANSYDNPILETNLSFKEYNEAGKIDTDKFLKLLQKFSGKYILLHKDITKSWIDDSKVIYATNRELEANNIVKKLDETDYFILYELDKKYLVPVILSDKSEIHFQKFNPVKYIINMQNVKGKTNLEFHQSYSSQWKLYLKSNPNNSRCKSLEYYENTKTTECEFARKIFEIDDLTYLWKKPIFDDTHAMVKEYANSWTIDTAYIKANYPKEFYKENLDGSIEIEMVLYFKPQSLFYAGATLSLFILVLCIMYLIIDFKKIQIYQGDIK